MIKLISISLIIFSIFALYIKFMPKSVFGVSFSKGHYLGFFFFYDFIVFVAPSSILLNLYPIENFWVAFKVNQEVVFSTTMIILVAYFLLVYILFLITKLVPKYFVYTASSLSFNNKQTYRRFVVYSVMASLFLILFTWVFLGAGHAFSLSIFLDYSISQTRFTLRDNMATKFISYFFIIICPFLMALIASPVFSGKVLLRCLMIIGVLFIATWGGSKAPVLVLFLVYFVSWATFANYRLNFKSLFNGLLFLIALMFFVYQVVLFQYPHLKDVFLFIDYFYQRVFVAQMIGIYEQFSLNIINSLYFFHAVPFASFFFDYPIFHKDLMMISEDRIDPSSIGIKNTFFLAEAYAMGGWLFILPAVIIYAVNFSLSYLITLLALNKFLVNNLEFNKVIVAIFLFSYLGVAGGFSDLMLFKIMIMLFILLSPVFLIAYFSRFKFVFSKRT